MNQKEKILQEGSGIMMPVMEPYGFVFSIEGEGHSCGGDFAFGSWRRENRQLELHFRFSLGLVTYHLKDLAVAHEVYLWAVTGKKKIGHYPGTSEDPLQAFHDLTADLQNYGMPFLEGSDEELRKILEKAHELNNWWNSLSPLKRLEIQ